MKRWIVRIVLCLILGCVTTVAVAWGAALSVDWLFKDVQPRGTSSNTQATGFLNFWHHDSRVVETISLIREPYRADLTNYESDEVLQMLPRGLSVERLVRDARPFQYWVSNLGSKPEPLDWELSGVNVVRSGWPYPALSYRFFIEDQWEIDLDDGILVRDDGPTSMHFEFLSTPVALPLRPIWPGLVINTLFYGVIWFGILFGFGSARRALRKKRGRCPKCAYDLRGEFDRGCSECGWHRIEEETEGQRGEGAEGENE